MFPIRSGAGVHCMFMATERCNSGSGRRTNCRDRQRRKDMKLSGPAADEAIYGATTPMSGIKHRSQYVVAEQIEVVALVHEQRSVRIPIEVIIERSGRLVWIPAARATSDATAPGSIASATIRSFSARDQCRRRCTDVITSTCALVIGLALELAPGLAHQTPHLGKAALTGPRPDHRSALLMRPRPLWAGRQRASAGP
jgi:hypothetical protein